MFKKKENPFFLQIAKLLIFLIIVTFLAIFFAKYIINNDFRDNINLKLFRQEISQEKLNVIEKDSEENTKTYAFGRYIALFEKNELTIYNNLAEKYASFVVTLINPISKSNGEYLALAEENGNKIYLINELGIKWENYIDQTIYRINVNKNGYVTVLAKDSTEQSIVITYDSNGNELFKIYSGFNYGLCANISDDNKYLGLCEINYSGTVIKSVVKLISIEKGKNNSKEAVLNTYQSESGKVLIDMEFNTKDELICVFNSYIQKITDLTDEKIYDIINDDIFVDIGLENDVIIAQKESTGLFSYEYQVNILSTIGKSNNLYILENDVPKKMVTSDNIFCLILSNELRIVNSNGWLLKKYTITRDIHDIIIGENIIGLVYNNKIEIIDL